MPLSLSQMSLGEYAESQSRLGVKIICKNGLYWRRIRPFFYRPVLPVTAIPEEKILPPPIPWPSGYQYAIVSPARSNSSMNFLMLTDLSSYSFDELGQKRRYIITRAAKQFEVRPIASAHELKEHGHSVYLSFFQRTGYFYKSDRIRKAVFDQWVDDIFANSKTILIGGYDQGRLVAFSTWYWVECTLVYTTLVSETEAMRKNLGDLMFHEVRTLAGRQRGLDEIFLRNYQGGNSIDQYHLIRGGQLIRKPARLCVPTSLLTVMRRLAPKQHELLLGSF